MKLTKFHGLKIVMIAIIFAVSSHAQAQTTQITFSRQEITVKQAFNEIKSQTRYGFAYAGSSFNTGRYVRFSSECLSLQEAMRQLTVGTGFGYSISHNIISVIKVAEEVKAAPVVMHLGERIGDIYQKSSPDDFSTQPIKREGDVENQGKEILSADTAKVEQLIEMTSYNVPIERYTATLHSLPTVALKTNLLYAAGTLTPNLGVEIGLGRRSTLELSGSYNPWNRTGTFESNKKLTHMILRAEYRYWFCERYNGHFIGGGAVFGRYNISTYDVPSIFKKQYRYNGTAYGAEAVYGYHFMIGKQWGIELSAGVGVLRFDYDRFNCAVCDYAPEKGGKTYFGPTNASASLIFLIK